ncbi:MAG: hypothetical protein OXD43_05295 [Bacteroidetes bacterium]|nr:hypothetical protein [Bacteroidota bacterium]
MDLFLQADATAYGPSMRPSESPVPSATKFTSVLTAITLASCSGSGRSAQEHLQIAHQDYVAFDFLAARDEFKQALYRDPENAEAA